MAIVNKVDLKLKIDIDSTIKYQIITFCFFRNIPINNSDLEFLSVLAKHPKMEISKFCILLKELHIFKSTQSARNAISKAAKKNLIIKRGHNKKTIVLNKIINVQKDGLVLLDYKILGSESKEA